MHYFQHVLTVAILVIAPVTFAQPQLYNYIQLMRFLIILLLTLTCLHFCLSSRKQTTELYQSLLNSSSINYKVYSGYGDINWYASPQFASIYYSLWESSTKSLSDHSAPLIIYLQGGPGFSSQFAAFREIGPLQILTTQTDYKAIENPWSWNYFGHLLFVDQPIGTGFSYNKMKDPDSTVLAAKHFVNFMYNFMKEQIWGLGSNEIYLAGEGYAGHFIPAFASAINQNKTLGFSITGVIINGGLVEPEKQANTMESFLGATGIVSEGRRNKAMEQVNNAIIRFRNGDNVGAVNFLNNVWTQQAANSQYNGINIHNYKRFSEDTEGFAYTKFLNDYRTKHGVSENVSFIEFNQHIQSAFTIDTMFKYTHNLQYLLESDVRVLIYNGQNDFKNTAAGMVTYLQSLQWKDGNEWRNTKKEIWKEAGRVSGWVKKYKNLVMTIVKGAGHFVYEDESIPAKSVFLLINKFLSKTW